MDISTANSEAYALYNKFHNSLNLSSKVAAAGVLTLKRIVDVPNGDIIMGTLVDTVGMPWGTNKPFPNPTKIADNVSKNLVNNTLIQSFSGFEHYLSNLIADVAHFSKKGNEEIFLHAHTTSDYDPKSPPEYSRCCHAYAEQFSKNNVLAIRIDELCNKLAIDKTKINRLKPLFEYFRNIRNCIVHLDGTANKDLTEAWEDENLKDSINFWDTLNRKKAPELPAPTRGKRIELQMTNAIMASALCFKIAQILNEEIPRLLGISGFIHMAAYYSLFIDFHSYREERNSRTAEAVIANFLSNRYYVQAVTQREIIHYCKEANIWQHCIERFNLLNPLPSDKVPKSAKRTRKI